MRNGRRLECSGCFVSEASMATSCGRDADKAAIYTTYTTPAKFNRHRLRPDL
jgi:hypothetical protein